MAVAGTLEVQMLANLARLQSDMTQAKDIVGKASADISKALSTVQSAAAALGVGLSAAMFGSLIKGSLDAMDNLNDLSKTTRIAAEELAGLQFAAKQSGTNLEATAGAITKLATNMGNNGDKFRALGISAKDPIEAFKQLADVTNAMNDPQQRAAVLAEALGKSWQQAAPLLAEGSAKIGEMIEKGKALSGITNENVVLTDELKDKWGELVGNGGVLNSTVGSMLPLLNQLADDLLKLKGDSQSGGFSFLAEILRVLIVLGGNVTFVLKALGIEIGGIAAQLAALAQGDFKRFADIGRQMKADAEANRKAFDLWEAGILAVGTAAKTTTPAIAAMDQVSRRQAQEATAAGRAFLQAEKDKRDAEAAGREAAAEAKRLRAEDIKGWVAHIEAMEAEYERGLKEMEKQTDAFYKEKRRLQDLDDKGWVAKIDAEIAEYERGLREMADKQPSHLQAMEAQWTTMWDNVSSVVGDFFYDLVMNGKNAFDNLKKFVKQLLAEMIALFAKRWVLQMAGVAGGSAVGGNSLAGGLMDAGTSAIGSYAGSYLASGVGTAAGLGTAGSMWAAAGAGVTATETGLAVSTGALAGEMGALYTTLASIPVWGWIAMAVIAIGAWIAGNHKGGDKVGGSFFSGGAVPGTDNGRFFTPNQGDEVVRQMVQATSLGYQDAVTRLGGTARGFNFGLGFDHDPQGTQQSRVSSMITDANGNIVYRRDNAGMDDKEVEAALALETQRMLVRALQETDLHDALDELFDGINVTIATSEQLQAVLAQALEMKSIIDVLAIWNVEGLDLDAIKALQRGGETLTQTIDRVGSALQTFEQLFYSESERHALGLERMNRQFEALGIVAPTSREAFRALVDSLDKDSPLWFAVISMAGAFDSLYPVIEDVGDVVEDVAETTVAAVQLFTAAVGQIVSGVNDPLTLYAQGAPARRGIGDWVTNFMTSNKSPLSSMDRLGLAETDFDKLIAAALGGDINAMGKLPGAADTLIGLLQQVYGSGQSSDKIRDIVNRMARIGEVPDFDARMLKSNEDMSKDTRSMLEVLIEIRDRADLNAEGVAGVAREGNREVAQAVKSAATATERL